MSELVFKFGTRSSGKSLELLSKANNLRKNNIKYQLFKPSFDNKTEDVIVSEIGLEEPCTLIGNIDLISRRLENNIKFILIDESHFLTKEQVDDLGYIVDNLNLEVICYGLRTDNQSNLFEGSKRLFEISDKIEEITSLCCCGKKNIYTAKHDENGVIDLSDDNEFMYIGDNKKYTSMCRKCYNSKILESVPYAEEV